MISKTIILFAASHKISYCNNIIKFDKTNGEGGISGSESPNGPSKIIDQEYIFYLIYRNIQICINYKQILHGFLIVLHTDNMATTMKNVS